MCQWLTFWIPQNLLLSVSICYGRWSYKEEDKKYCGDIRQNRSAPSPYEVVFQFAFSIVLLRTVLHIQFSWPRSVKFGAIQTWRIMIGHMVQMRSGTLTRCNGRRPKKMQEEAASWWQSQDGFALWANTRIGLEVLSPLHAITLSLLSIACFCALNCQILFQYSQVFGDLTQR